MAGGLDFLINIQQKLTGGNVASQLGDLEKKIKAEGTALAALERQMAKMQKGKSVDIESYQKLQGAIDAKKGSIGALQNEMISLTGKTDESTGAVGGFGKALQSMKAGPAAAAIAVLVVIATAIVVATYKLASFALGAADAARSFGLILQGATGSAAGATAAAAAIDRVGRTSAMAKGELQQLAQSLLVAKLSGKLFEDTLRSIATVSSVAGSEAAGKIDEIAKKSAALGHFEFGTKALMGLGISIEDIAKKMGISVAKLDAQMKAGKITVEKGLDALNAAVQSRFGAVAAKQLLGFDVQVMKAHENLAALFKDVKIESFLVGLQSLLSMLDSSTSSGKALKYVLTSMMNGFFTVAAAVLPYVKALFIGLLIAGLQIYTVLKPAIRAIAQVLGFNGKSSEAGLAAMVMVGRVLGYIFVFLGVVLAVSIAAMSALIGAFTGMGPAVIGAFGLIVGIVGQLLSYLGTAVSSIGGFAGRIIDGLVAGITGGIGRAVGAIKGLASAMSNAFTGAMIIHSPSGLFRAHGRQLPAGAALGVEDGTDDVQGAVDAMVTPPAPTAGKGRSSATAGRSFGDIKIYIQGRDAAEIWAQLEEKVLELFDGAGLSGPAPSGAT